jgi:sulfane dehydrogenase subunit SoxC
MDISKPTAQKNPSVQIPHRMSDMKDFITADEDLFVLSHLEVPEIAPKDWCLTIGGLVERPFALSYDELTRLPSVSLTAFHKCAGSPLNPRKPTPERIGNVTWSGIPLASLLREAIPLPEAAYVWSSGSDRGSFQDIQFDGYTKDLELGTALNPEVLLAYEMNGKPLRASRGGPVRLLIPGYYGTNSVKWLRSIELANARAPGLFTTTWYNDRVTAEDGRLTTIPVWGVAPDSAIVSPEPGRRFPEPDDIIVSGWAWGDEEIVGVDVSLNAGRTWLPTEVDARLERSWQAFRITLPVLEQGIHQIVSRATDRLHRRQPLDGARNAAVPVEITVRGLEP